MVLSHLCQSSPNALDWNGRRCNATDDDFASFSGTITVVVLVLLYNMKLLELKYMNCVLF